MPWVTTAQRVRLPVFSERAGGALARAAARVCREAGARVATNIFYVDVHLADGRRIEVLATGQPRWQGARRPSTPPCLASYAGGRLAATCRSCPRHGA